MGWKKKSFPTPIFGRGETPGDITNQHRLATPDCPLEPPRFRVGNQVLKPAKFHKETSNNALQLIGVGLLDSFLNVPQIGFG